ncbi:MAG TPA: hypothetical protein VFG79_04800 [Solirubrobacter sp.]|jgi:hypothetical protein|nr:hypothetical protein [Solirubrobacter sp.]
MRWTIFAALLGALLLAPAAHAAGPIQIIRDCEDDGVLQGSYTASELRNARSNLPTDIDEYSDCRDVLSRAIAAKTQNAGGGTNTGGGAPTGGGTTGGGGGGGNSNSPLSRPDAAEILGGPSTPQDAAAVADAAQNGDRSMTINGRPVSPGESRLASVWGRNGLPATTIAVLALIGAALLAAFVPAILRRRGIAPGKP